MSDLRPNIIDRSRKATRGLTAPTQAMIEDRVEADTNGGCWLWRSAPSGDGYGAVRLNGRRFLAHRASYEAFNGPVGSSWVLHRCDVRLCVNPAHLFLGDNSANVADRDAKGRSAKVLTAESAAAIRASSESSRVAARRFGVTSSLVRRIRRGGAWKTASGQAVVNPNPVADSTGKRRG